jgi:hypothetical protein
MRKQVDAGKVCEHCGSMLIRPKEDFFCDKCQNKIQDNVHLSTTIFFDDDRYTNTDYQFDSWKCLFEFLKDMKIDKKDIRFISMPILSGSGRDFETDWKEMFDAMYWISNRADGI